MSAATAAGVAATVGGCAWFGDEPVPPEPDPLAPLLADTRRLADRYAQVIQERPELANPLTPLHEAHQAHVAALRELVEGVGGAATDAPDASPTTGSWAPPLLDPDASDEELLEDLRDREQLAATEAIEACLAAPGERAGLLGAIAAARVTHAEVLP